MNRYAELYRTVLEEHEKVFEAQPVDALESALDVIAGSSRIFVYGAGREGIAARAFAMRLMHLGKEVCWLLDDTAPGMTDGDLFIAVNGSGCIGYIDYFLEQAGRNHAVRLVVTGSPENDSPRAAEHCLFVPAAVYKGTDGRVVKSVQPMGNLFEQHLFLLFDIMIMLLSERMHISEDDMTARHRNVE